MFTSAQVCLSNTTSTSLSYSLENDFNLGYLDSMNFVSINPSNGTIYVSASRFSSNFTHNVTAKASVNTKGILVAQAFTLYDLRLYFSDLKNFTMLIGDTIINKTTWYNNTLNPLTFDPIILNGTSLPPAPYFI